MKILLETKHAVLIDKPAGWLSVPGRDPKDTRQILGRELESHLKIQIYPIHRLDAEVSGLILYAKTPEFHKEANRLFEQKLIHKTYEALSPKPEFALDSDFEWKTKILRGKKRTYEASYGKLAITKARVKEEVPKGVRWELEPVTGRPHQLRFELAHRGCPIWGDNLYGSEVSWEPGIALRSVKMVWPEEFSQKWELPAFYEISGL